MPVVIATKKTTSTTAKTVAATVSAVRLGLRHTFRQASRSARFTLLPLLQIPRGEDQLVEELVEAHGVDPDARLVPLLLERIHHPQVRKMTTVDLANVGETHGPHAHPVFVVEVLAQRRLVLDLDPAEDLSPHDGRVLVGDVFEDVGAQLAIAFGDRLDPQQAVIVVVHVARVVDEVVVGEVAAHPRLQHHRGWDPHGALHPRHVGPEIGGQAQEGRARVLRGGLDADEGAVAEAIIPRDEGHDALGREPRRRDGHRRLHVGLVAAHRVIGAARDLAGAVLLRPGADFVGERLAPRETDEDGDRQPQHHRDSSTQRCGRTSGSRRSR
jgi:hypothetical protein